MILIFAENGDTVTNSVIDWLDHFKANWIRLNEYDLVEVQSINLRNKEVNINLRFKSEYGPCCRGRAVRDIYRYAI
jgi:hypothetical protein